MTFQLMEAKRFRGQVEESGWAKGIKVDTAFPCSSHVPVTDCMCDILGRRYEASGGSNA